MNRDLPSIQSMRAVAALMVVVYHISQWTRPVFTLGQAGVDLFFVISGVVLWLSAAEGDADPATFLARRAVRIAPPYWIATLVCIPLALYFPAVFGHAHPTPSHVALSMAFIPHLDPENQPFPLLVPGWSLNYEAVFYLVMAAALLMPKAARLPLVFMAMTGAFMFGLTHHPAYFLGANALLFEFAAGCALGYAFARRALPSVTVGLALIVVGIVAFILARDQDNLFRPFFWGVPATMIIGGVLSLEQAGTAPRVWLTEKLGDASYSIYLWHSLVIPMMTLAIPAVSPLYAPAAFAAALCAGIASHRLIETPFHRLSRRLKGFKSAPAGLSTRP